MLRLDQLTRGRVVDSPYSHVVLENALDELSRLNTDFSSKDQFGPTIRMDGDLTAGDQEYEELIS